MAVTSDWQVSYGGLDMGAGTVYRLQPPVEGLQDYPEVRTSDQGRLRRHGLTPGADFLGLRTTTWRFRVTDRNSTSFAAAWSAFRAALSPGVEDEAPLTFQAPGVAGGGVRRIIGRPRRLAMPIDLVHKLGSAVATVQFECSDPRIYDDALTSLSTDLSASVGAHAWNQAWNMSWGGASAPSTVTCTNTGTYSTPWTATVAGPVTNPTIENVATGQVLAFTGDGGLTLASGDSLVVDSDTRTVLLNGTASRYSKLATPVSWWDLAPGDTVLRFGGTTVGAPTMTVSFRSAWI